MDWNQFDRGVFLLNVLGIIYDREQGKVLIGRRESDPFISELTWCFPGGRPAYDEDLEYYLELEIKKKTNLEVKTKNCFFAKTYPEAREFLSIYYLCEVTGGEEQAGEKFVEIKWVLPEQVKEFFTTSLHPKLNEYLMNINEL